MRDDGNLVGRNGAPRQADQSTEKTSLAASSIPPVSRDVNLSRSALASYPERKAQAAALCILAM